MKTKQSVAIVFLAAFAGFVGGLISNQIFEPRPALAQKESAPSKIVSAQEFRVVDTDGRILGRFGVFGDLPDLGSKQQISKAPAAQLRLGQETGFQIILSSGDAAGSRIVMKDEKNKTRMVIGNTEFYMPQTQVIHRRPLSSIVLFDDRGRFEWSAPGGIRKELGR
jgi:hypothetical protein